MKLLLFGFLGAFSLWAGNQELLPAKKIDALKKRPCTLIHVWATWCDICTKEMASFIGFLETQKKINPVLIDVSGPLSQDSFSKKFMQGFNTPFKTYLKPPGDDIPYLKAIDSDRKWQGALPYTALYHKGKLKEKWIGSVDFKKISKEVTSHCR